MPKQKLPNKNFKWSPKLAYAIGLLVTDGNLSKDGRHITMRSCDLEQLKNFRTSIDVKNNKIGFTKIKDNAKQKICYRLQFSNIQLYNWLLKIGLMPAKSLSIGAIKIPDNYFRDFLRGHLDGDGSITSYRDTYNAFKHSSYIYTRLFVRFISASKTHIHWLRKKIIELVDIKGDLSERLPIKAPAKNAMWQLKFMKKESIKLLHWLYYKKNIPALARKRKMAEQTLATIAKIKRKMYTFNSAKALL